MDETETSTTQDTVAVYLDQNVLSDLRPRKWQETINPYSVLWFVFQKSNAVLCASHTTIDEILQIPKQEYIDEHTKVLKDIGFYYRHGDDTIYKKILDVDDFIEGYVDNQNTNHSSGIDSAMQSWDKALRKSHGLEIEESYPELIGDIFVAFKDMLLSVLPKNFQVLFYPLLRIDREKVEAKVQLWLDENPDFLESEENLLKLRQRTLRLGNLEEFPTDSLLENVFEAIGLSKDSIENMVENHKSDKQDLKLALGFFILNFAGFHADDFRSIKKGKDRFRSSQNDYRHLCHAKYSHFLLTEDVKFREKAKAIYRWAGISTQVLTTSEFLKTVLPKDYNKIFDDSNQ